MAENLLGTLTVTVRWGATFRQRAQWEIKMFWPGLGT
jgi:hypothetical protein